MFRWISDKLGNSPGGSAAGSPTSSPRRIAETAGSSSWNAAFASDPAEWEQGFDNCWVRAEKLLDKPLIFPDKDITFNEMQELMRLVHNMVQFLMMEVNAQPEPAIGPILDRFFTHQIIERVLDWALHCPDFLRPTCQLSLIRAFEHIVTESHSQNHCLLVHKPVLNPLLRLFSWCRKPECAITPQHREGPTKTDTHFVILLNQICGKMAEDATLLHFFFTCTDEFMVFSLLIPFLYEQNDVGQLARDALLLILSVSSKQREVAEFVAHKSAFCPVVATGLSGVFSQLQMSVQGDGSERLLGEGPGAAALVDFHSSLVFCNAVVQAAHKAVVDKITEYFYSGFLVLVVKPALLQDYSEQTAAATVYLQVCLETLSEPELVRTVVRMLLVERDDEGTTLLEVVVRRVEAADKLAVVSLSLLEALLSLSCEDVVLVLALRSLLPLRGVTRSQLARVRDRATAQRIASRLLAAIPTAIQRFPEVASQSTLHLYLKEAGEMVDTRARACAVWKWKYDGVSPPPALFRADSDDEGHTPFTRLSSVRSSFSSGAQGLNRYFASSSRSGHLTSDSIGGGGGHGGGHHLGELGASPLRSPSTSIDEDSPLEEDAEFILPPITSASMMTSSMVDYLTLTAYDSLSESDGDKEIIVIEEREVDVATPTSTTKAGGRTGKKEQKASESGGDSSLGGFDTDAEMARSFVLSGWTDVKDMATFMELLDHRPLPKALQNMNTGGRASSKDPPPPSMAELTAFIDGRLQYMRECNGEEDKENAHARPEVNCEEDDGEEEERERRREAATDTGVRGQPIEEDAESSTQLLSVVLDRLATLADQSMAYNIQLCSIVYTLASFPQPLLIAHLFREESKDGGGESMITVLESVRTRIDEALATMEGSEMWIRRANRNMQLRADRIERAPDAVWPRPAEHRSDAGRDMEHGGGGHAPLGRARPFGGSGRRYGFRYHTHLAIESESARDDTRAKELVHAAIILANLCQMLAAIALHHATVVVPK